MPPSEEGVRYTRVAVVFHWLVAALVILELGWGWWMQEIPKQPPGQRADAFNLHKSIGLTVLLLMVARLGWRLAHPPPPLPPMPRVERAPRTRQSRASCTRAVFALTIGGYLGSAWSGFPVKFFGYTLPSWSAGQPALKEWASTVHLVSLVAARGRLDAAHRRDASSTHSWTATASSRGWDGAALDVRLLGRYAFSSSATTP